jgi:hypothetical protein
MRRGTRRELIRTSHYWIDEHRGDREVALSDAPGFRVLMCVDGSARAGSIEMTQGSTVVVPACAVDTAIVLDGTLLEVGMPVPS